MLLLLNGAEVQGNRYMLSRVVTERRRKDEEERRNISIIQSLQIESFQAFEDVARDDDSVGRTSGHFLHLQEFRHEPVEDL